MSVKVTKRRWYLNLYLIIPVVAVIVGGLAMVLGDTGLWSSYKLSKTRAAQAEQIRKLEAQKKQLSSYLDALKAKDDVALERAARDLKLAAPNETIYDIKVESKK